MVKESRVKKERNLNSTIIDFLRQKAGEFESRCFYSLSKQYLKKADMLGKQFKEVS